MQQKQPPKSVVRDREESRDPATTAGFFFRLLEGKREEEGPSKSQSIPVAEPLLLRFSSSPYFRAPLKTLSRLLCREWSCSLLKNKMGHLMWCDCKNNFHSQPNKNQAEVCMFIFNFFAMCCSTVCMGTHVQSKPRQKCLLLSFLKSPSIITH